MKLPDVNVWLAAAWSRHVHHPVAKAWLDAQEGDLAFCRVTELAFLRLVSNPAVTGTDVLSRRAAWNLLLALQRDPRIRYMPEPRGVAPVWIALSKRDDQSHRLWTDDFLAAFAQVAGAQLVTFDTALAQRHPSVDVELLK